jgi:hypothetical protein
MMMKCVRNPANEMALVGMERDLSTADLRAIWGRFVGASVQSYERSILPHYERKSPTGLPSCYRSSISN